MKKIILLAFTVILFIGCNKDLYTYYNYNDLVYTYAKGYLEDKEVKKITKQYKKIVESPKGENKMPPSGSCADYAYLLYKQGDKVRAKEYFKKEMLFYPESKKYIENLMNKLEL
jgi:hypothetical protein